MMNGVIPQMVMVPSALSALECQPPAETAVYCPSGASVRPLSLSPQQAMVPSVRSAHVCAALAETAVYCPAGASASAPRP